MIYFILNFFKLYIYSFFYFLLIIILHFILSILLIKNFKINKKFYLNIFYLKNNSIKTLNYLKKFKLCKIQNYNLSFNENFSLYLLDSPILKVNDYFFFKKGYFLSQKWFKENSYKNITKLNLKENINFINFNFLTIIYNSIKEASNLDNFENFYYKDGAILALKENYFIKYFFNQILTKEMILIFNKLKKKFNNSFNLYDLSLFDKKKIIYKKLTKKDFYEIF